MEPHVKQEPPTTLVTVKQLKEDVFHNIEMLFNSRCHSTTFDTASARGDVKSIEDSVLGFGIKDFCGKPSSEESREEMRLHIVRQIMTFEPRIEPSSIAVDFVESKSGAVLEYSISGILKLKEVKEELVFLSRLDIETGIATLRIADD
jgi:type VI secretion system lysozyme-like protein